MEKLKKVLSIVTIVSAIIVAIFLIFWLFGLDFLGDFKSSVYFTLGSIAVGGFFAINSLNMLIKNKILGWVSFGLISGSVFLIILSSWLNLHNSIFINIMITMGLLSVLFNVIVSSGLDLGKKYLALQIPIYVITAIVDLFTSLMVFGVLDISNMLALYLAMIIIAFVGIIILKVLAKRQLTYNLAIDKNSITISKTEYDILIDKENKYDALMSNSSKDTNKDN